MAVVLNRTTDALPPSRDLVFCDSICCEGVDDLVSVGLVDLFEIQIAIRFWVELSFAILSICSP